MPCGFEKCKDAGFNEVCQSNMCVGQGGTDIGRWFDWGHNQHNECECYD